MAHEEKTIIIRREPLETIEISQVELETIIIKRGG